MSQNFSGRFCLAAAAFLFTAIPRPARAQISAGAQRRPLQTAAVNLPDAPEPHAFQQSTTPPAGSSTSARQQPAPQQPAPDASTKAPATTGTITQRQQADEDIKKEEHQRLLGIMPNFNVVLNGKAVPLTSGQKWNLALHSAFDPFQVGYAFISGGYSEVADTDNGYHWGPAGYFKRAGATYADNLNGAIVGNAFLPSILHQDPRYFRMGVGPKKKRFIHAALSTVVCLGDNGKKQANISNVLGNLVSGAISNAYYPADQRGLGLTFENAAQVTAFGAVGGQILEFAPDIIAHFKNRHNPPVTPAPPLAMPPANPPTP